MQGEVWEAGQPETITASPGGKAVVGPEGVGAYERESRKSGETLVTTWLWLQGMRDRGE